jgi:exopolysaccharide biosynthesis polyprenyl glycosylphosphotransferase
MRQKFNLTFTALLLPLDVAALMGSALTAYGLRFSQAFIEIRPILTQIEFERYVVSSVGFAVVWIVLFAMAGLYAVRPRRAWDELGRLFVAGTAGAMILIATVFFQRELTTSRFIVLAVWALSILFVFMERLLIRVVRHALLRARVGHERIVLIGHGNAVQQLLNLYQQEPVLGFSVIKQFPTWNASVESELRKLIRNGRVDEVLLADTDLPKEQALDLIAFAEEQHVTFKYLADLFAATFTNIEMTMAGGIPVIEVKRTRLDGWGRIFKRAFDIVVSLILLVITAPLVLLAMIALALEDGWPTIFYNDRVGVHGAPFMLYKLRSMWRRFCIGSQFPSTTAASMRYEKRLIQERSMKRGAIYKIADDPRHTPIGRFLRRWSIDELPQLWNVLKGEMSLVGPRPHQPREVNRYEPHQRRVLAIRPGITGMAQISGRSDLALEDEVRLDTWYIEHWSPLLDLYILLKTPFVVVQKKGAY